ncbi:uncharacterized protein LOC124434789 [Xenia sp. Carnegie-2017]|uniref:uncharacterized protein LOC124434789 n=1 Tax=Xenia sp. Carnegie-2017 TaxID=2897299 RepID=UPI001F046357|nr:uncharacterized protein LOC124434789 [Xenia sp. Carnegie-2017]
MATSRIFSVLIILVAFAYVTTRRKFASPKQLMKHCPKVYNQKCFKHDECKCNYPVKLICNHKKQCGRITIAYIMSKIRCPKVFKKKCTSDKDCKKCRGLICEDKECVFQKKVKSI